MAIFISIDINLNVAIGEGPLDIFILLHCSVITEYLYVFEQC